MRPGAAGPALRRRQGAARAAMGGRRAGVLPRRACRRGTGGRAGAPPLLDARGDDRARDTVPRTGLPRADARKPLLHVRMRRLAPRGRRRWRKGGGVPGSRTGRPAPGAAGYCRLPAEAPCACLGRGGRLGTAATRAAGACTGRNGAARGVRRPWLGDHRRGAYGSLLDCPAPVIDNEI